MRFELKEIALSRVQLRNASSVPEIRNSVLDQCSIINIPIRSNIDAVKNQLHQDNRVHEHTRVPKRKNSGGVRAHLQFGEPDQVANWIERACPVVPTSQIRTNASPRTSNTVRYAP
jgi:hypothetical protein